MKFIVEDEKHAVRAIASRLCDELLAGKRVLWLTSGGSNVALQVAIMDIVHDHCDKQLKNLTIMPMDERYGRSGHINSNTEFMRKNGFRQGLATWHDVLAHDTSFEETLEYYSELALDALAEANIVIGQFGLGADGHVAGILPGSPATEEDFAMIVGYEWHDYTRMTLSLHALIENVHVAYVPAYGDGKKEALERLRRDEETIEALPAHLLGKIPEVYIYNKFITNKG